MTIFLTVVGIPNVYSASFAVWANSHCVLTTLRESVIVARISCRWQTRATRCITTNVLQTNKVDAQCDKLATELSWQRFASKVANLQLPHLHLTYPTCIWRLHWGWPRLSFAEIFGVRKRELWAIVWRCSRDPTFSLHSVEHRLVTDRRTDGQRRTTTANTSASRG